MTKILCECGVLPVTNFWDKTPKGMKQEYSDPRIRKLAKKYGFIKDDMPLFTEVKK